MKSFDCFVVIPKNSELADLVGESTNGILVPLFSSEVDAHEWRHRTNRAAETLVEPIRLQRRAQKGSK